MSGRDCLGPTLPLPFPDLCPNHRLAPVDEACLGVDPRRNPAPADEALARHPSAADAAFPLQAAAVGLVVDLFQDALVRCLAAEVLHSSRPDAACLDVEVAWPWRQQDEEGRLLRHREGQEI